MNKANLYKLINTTLSILVALAAIYYLVYLIQEKELNFDLIAGKLNESWYMVLLAFLFMPINWILETFKWRSLVLQVQNISIINSFKSILAGILLSLVTPNRVGELGGKLIYITKENRATVLYINSVCSISQLLVTILAGLLSLFFLKETFSIWLEIEDAFMLVSIGLLSALLLVIFFKSNSLVKLFKLFSKKKAVHSIRINTRSRLKLLVYSLARYLVFCIQFYLLVQIFETEISFFESSMTIAMIFFLTAVVPTGWISDLPVRTSIAFFVFELMSFSGSSGLSASILLWLINLLIPAFFSLFLLRNIDWMEKLKWRIK